ncbi:hypothetical protein BC670_0290 [Flavobacterium branchiophilum]|uniref:Uncharacterized protein n=1 Tax=Flavobacterium branchiophilum TaxID=55197 RepID=A0A543G084_9FLAO|nr:hypothetical protein BC670_0290 [Flavobacterium branchiophilum]
MVPASGFGMLRCGSFILGNTSAFVVDSNTKTPGAEEVVFPIIMPDLMSLLAFRVVGSSPVLVKLFQMPSKYCTVFVVGQM